MQTASRPPAPASRLTRSRSGRVLGGVASGIARHLGLPVLAVRVAFVVLAVAWGAGCLLYLLGWLLLPADGDPPAPAASAAEPDDTRAALALGMLVLGILLLLRETGVWFDDGVVWPVVLGAMGLYVLWRRVDERERLSLAARSIGARRASLARVVLGALLVAAGVALALAANVPLDAVRDGLVATAVLVAGVGLIFGPWWRRLAHELAEERRQRIRSEERAEVASHLHDSVLQTLALIQRRAGDARAVTALARRQERELRAWLYGAAPARPGDSLASALQALGVEVEDLHGTVVDVVTVGDCPLDESLGAVVEAAREALVNAAKHSGDTSASVYAEVEPDRVAVFVRDRGAGFDASAVGGTRLGIAKSIVGRMQRHGGEAIVRSAPGEGTEVALTVRRGAR